MAIQTVTFFVGTGNGFRVPVKSAEKTIRSSGLDKSWQSRIRASVSAAKKTFDKADDAQVMVQNIGYLTMLYTGAESSGASPTKIGSW